MASAHRITVTPRDVRVRVRVGDVTVADSRRPVVLEETGLPTRYYLPPEDVRTDLLRPTSSTTRCPFKGEASYWSVVVGSEVHEDVVWSYRKPLPEVSGIAGLLCFYNHRVDLVVEPGP
jgi:uncharacterized protein (DUF427 family)